MITFHAKISAPKANASLIRAVFCAIFCTMLTLTPVKANVEFIFMHVKSMNSESCSIGAVFTTTTTTYKRCHLNFVGIEKYS